MEMQGKSARGNFTAKGTKDAKGRGAGLQCRRVWSNRTEHMTAEQILVEIKALPPSEREKLVESVRHLSADDFPADFAEALDDFAHGRFVSMDTVLNETPLEK